MKFFSTHQFVASVALAALSFGAHSVPVFSLANNGSSLIRFDSATPGAVTVVGNISGATTNLNGLDFRPMDGFLYGYQQANSGIYRVNTGTGATTFVSTSSAPVTDAQLGIDFNPVPDRLRVVTTADENRRINVDTGAAIIDGTLAYAVGDVNFGRNPSIIDAAYTNSDTNPATGTQLYYIDIARSTLVTTTNPNGGVLNTVGSLGVNTNRFVGFDIFTDLGGINTAFASLTTPGGAEGLYTINLGTGLATLVGTIGANQLFGLAVAPTAIPEPGSLALFAVASLAAAFGLRRRATGKTLAATARDTAAT